MADSRGIAQESGRRNSRSPRVPSMRAVSRASGLPPAETSPSRAPRSSSSPAAGRDPAAVRRGTARARSSRRRRTPIVASASRAMAAETTWPARSTVTRSRSTMTMPRATSPASSAPTSSGWTQSAVATLATGAPESGSTCWWRRSSAALTPSADRTDSALLRGIGGSLVPVTRVSRRLERSNGHNGSRRAATALSSRHTSGDAPATRREGADHRGRRPPYCSDTRSARRAPRDSVAARPHRRPAAGAWSPVSRSQPKGDPHDWVTRAADDAVRHHEQTGADGPVTCSSGISPSGPVHLGNMREFLMPHFVADELRRRGVPVRHLHVWDDYDRFRKVPRGVDPAFAEHIGRPLVDVPDPWGCHDSWSTHFKEPVLETFAALGAEVDTISQAERYRAGVYREEVLRAVRHRGEIDAVLAKYRTKKTVEPEPGDQHAVQEAEAMADSVANDVEAEESASGVGYFPFKPYCRDCGRDTTTVTSYDDETTDLAYTCSVCDYHGTTNLATQDPAVDGGKLVWKADWPMRWAFEHVDFEPAGMDHATPGSSFTVGHELVESVWNYPRPAWFGYGFVGFAGVQKMSSSAGGAPTAEEALQVLEPGILRWLYVRRQPKQTFDVDFGPEVVRLYDEWDALGRKAADPERRDVQVLAYERAASTATAGALPAPDVVVPFRMLSSVADVTAGKADQISRIIATMGHPHDSVDQLEPRLSRAVAWTEQFVPATDRTTVRSEPDLAAVEALSPQEREWVSLLLQGLQGDLELEQVTSLVYGVPKLARGMSLEEKPTDEVKADQKEFFRLLYHLLVDAERGPRLPTLIVALGSDRVRTLLGA